MRWLDWLREKPQRDAAATLLRVEVDSNLRLLEQWWGKLKPRKGEDEIHWVDKVVYAREFADATLPEFRREVYLQEQPSLSSYIRGDKLKRVVQLYDNLGKLAQIQQELRRALEKDLALRLSLEGQLSSAGRASPTFDNFLSVAPWSWREAARVIDVTLTQGNPLGKKSTPL